MIKKAGAIIEQEGKILLVRKTGTPFFILPGGKYEHNESALDCLTREVKEEVDLSVVSCTYRYTLTGDAANESNSQVQIEVYQVEWVGVPRPQNEIEEIWWVPGGKEYLQDSRIGVLAQKVLELARR